MHCSANSWASCLLSQRWHLVHPASLGSPCLKWSDKTFLNKSYPGSRGADLASQESLSSVFSGFGVGASAWSCPQRTAMPSLWLITKVCLNICCGAIRAQETFLPVCLLVSLYIPPPLKKIHSPLLSPAFLTRAILSCEPHGLLSDKLALKACSELEPLCCALSN